MKIHDIIEHTDSEKQQKDPKSAGSRGLTYVTKKIADTKKLANPITKNEVDKK
jgi:hypothetical protein